MAKLEFKADDKRLLLSVDTDGIKWCTLFIESDKKVVRLGSEMYEILKDKFSVLQAAAEQKTIVYDGVSIFPIMNLSEPHASLAGSPIIDGVELYLLDINNKFYPVMKLNNSDIDGLKTTLENFNP